MKKLCLLLALLFCFVFFGGCSVLFPDETTADRKFEKLIVALENEDSDAIKELFSANVIENVDTLDQAIDDMEAFFEGGSASIKMRAGQSSHSTTKEGELMEVRRSYDVTTDSGTYRFAIKYVVIDSEADDRVGFESVYIIKAEQTNQKTAWYGDGRFTPGVNIIE